MSFNLAIMLRESRNAAPAKRFLRFPDGSLTYAEVDTLSGQFAASLRRRGWRPGDKIAVQLANVPEFVIAYFGILKAGLTMVPIGDRGTHPAIWKAGSSRPGPPPRSTRAEATSIRPSARQAPCRMAGAP